MFGIIHVLMVFGFLPGPGAWKPVDLRSIPRCIQREPTYHTGKPKYCLLVFGPAANKRIWLVLDGRDLYADRDGTGELTKKDNHRRAVTWGGPGGTHFEFGALTCIDGKKVHLSVLRNEQADHFDSVSVSIEGEYEQSVGIDTRGLFKFAARPQDAPIVHFFGPLEIALLSPTTLSRQKAQDVILRLGTAGYGPGTFATLATDSIPREVHPRVTIEFAGKIPGQTRLTATYTLKQRC